MSKRPSSKLGAKRLRKGARLRLPRWSHILLLEFAALAAYSNSFGSGMLFDSAVILRDSRIQGATAEDVRRVFTEPYWAATPTAGLYRPLTTLSYLLNYAVLGNRQDPAGYHWVNFAVHGINIALVYALGLLIFGGEALPIALAAIWGLHPLLTESVTNVAGRPDLLATMGVLAGMLCYARALESAGRRRLAWLGALAAAQAVGVFSKENAIVLPGLILLYDLTVRGRNGWRDRLPAWPALALPLAAYFWLRSQVGVHLVVPVTDNPLAGAGFWAARLTAVKVIGAFAGLFLWPARLSADYSYNCVPVFAWPPFSWEDAKALLAVAFCLGLLALALWAWRARQPLFFWLVFFFIAAAPTSNLVFLIGSIMAERFLYLPAVGLAGCLVVAIDAASRRLLPERRSAFRAAAVAMGLGCFALATRTYARNFDWHDDLALWSNAVEACPESVKAHINLGHGLSQLDGRLPDAIREYEAAVRIQPGLAQAHYNLGSVLLQIPERQQDALAEFREAIRIDPRQPEAYYNMGAVLSHIPGKMDEAIAALRAALDLKPDHVGAHNDLGNVFAQTGRLPEAIAEFQAALRSEPEFSEAHNNLGVVLAQMPGREQEAIAEFRAAVRFDPGLANAHRNLGMALAAVPGHLSEAIAELQTADQTHPDPEIERLIEGLRAQVSAR